MDRGNAAAQIPGPFGRAADVSLVVQKLKACRRPAPAEEDRSAARDHRDGPSERESQALSARQSGPKMYPAPNCRRKQSQDSTLGPVISPSGT